MLITVVPVNDLLDCFSNKIPNSNIVRQSYPSQSKLYGTNKFYKIDPRGLFLSPSRTKISKSGFATKVHSAFYLSPGASSLLNNLSEKKNYYFRRKVSYYDEKKKMPLVDYRIVALPKRLPFAPGTCTWQHLAFLLSIDTSDNIGTMREANECPNALHKVKKSHFYYRNKRSQLVEICSEI